MSTAPDPQTFDQILEQTFPKDIQQKRIRKELISLNDLDQNYYKINLQNSPLGLKVVVEFTELFIQQEIQQNHNLQLPIILELLLDSQFPFNLPKLLCRTNIYQPSLADGRDFLVDAIERQWSPTILLREVITSIPVFLKKVNKLHDPADSQKMGQYYISDLYSLEDMLGYESVNLFTAEEVIDKNIAPRYIVIAESHFLKLETADNSRNTLKLLTWANLNSIANVKRSKDDERSLLITFLDEKTNSVAKLMLLTKEANKLEELLLDLGERYGARIKQGAISDFDLTPYISKLTRQITEKNVEEALEDIQTLENRLEIDVTKDLVYALMAFYQKIVEHFATYDDPLVDEFVSKLRSLMEREDVQIALKNNQEKEEKQRTHTLTKQKTIDTDIEDEEEKKESNEPYSWQDQDDNNASLDGNEQVIISQSQKLEVQRPVPEEVKNQQDDEWNEYESKGTEEDHRPEAEKETHEIVENHEEKEQAVESEPQENIEYRQEQAEPQDQVQAHEEEAHVPVHEEEAYIEQKDQEEEDQVQENQEEEFEGYQQEAQEAQNIQEEVQEGHQQNVEEEQTNTYKQEEVEEVPAVQNEEVVEEVNNQQAQEIPAQNEQEEENVEEQQEEVQVQENKEEDVIENREEQENQVVENEEKREEVEENQVQDQAGNVENKAEEEQEVVVDEPAEKEEAIENKEESQVPEKQEVQVEEEQHEEKEEVHNENQEEAQVQESQNEQHEQKEEVHNENQEEAQVQVQENQNEQQEAQEEQHEEKVEEVHHENQEDNKNEGEVQVEENKEEEIEPVIEKKENMEEEGERKDEEINDQKNEEEQQ